MKKSQNIMKMIIYKILIPNFDFSKNIGKEITK